MKALHLALCLPLTLACLAAHADVAIPVANGSFEDGFTNVNATSGQGISVTPNSWTLLTSGGESRSGWSQSGTSPASPDGGGWWSLEYVTGWNSSTGAARFNAGGIKETLTGLTIGDTYSLSFYSMANAPASSSANHLAEYWAVSFGGSTKNGATVYSDQPTVWTQSTLSFVATASSQVLSFMGTWLNATPGNTPTYLNLDGIKLTDVSAVPEPTSISLSLAGLGFIGALMRLRSRRKSEG